MPKISCPECNKISDYATLSDSMECSYCGVDFDRLSGTEISMGEESNIASQKIVGLTLTYQINHEQIEILPTFKTMLGRENFGGSVLSKIFFNGEKVISRKHCSIEYKDGKFYLQDEGSKNGTFYGDNKTSCKNSAQIIEDGGFVYLGEELFHAKIRYQPQNEIENRQEEVKVEEDKAVADSIPAKYRCNDPNCSPPYETVNPPNICPRCGAFKRFILINDI